MKMCPLFAHCRAADEAFDVFDGGILHDDLAQRQQ